MSVIPNMMNLLEFYPGGIYFLNRKKEYIFANRYFLAMVNLSMEEILYKDVHELKDRGCYDVCISDIAFDCKCAIAVFSNVSIRRNGVVKKERFLNRAIPILGENGEVINMLAICDPVDKFYDNLYEAENRSRGGVPLDSGFRNIMVMDSEEDDFSLVAESEAMRKLIQDCDRIAGTDSTVLLSGASGVGKEIIAEYLHRKSNRSSKDMIVVNCAALPANLLEANLFGYDKGAFTGALKEGKMGLIEAADGGTLFLDEISSLPMELQGKLLRTIETKTVQPIGSIREKPVDFRLITATNEDLKAMVDNGSFRADLYYRLNVIPLTILPLRERVDDISTLFDVFLQEFNKKYNKEVMISRGGRMILTEYAWPGNVRELKNMAERLVVMTPGRMISEKDVIQELYPSEDLSEKSHARNYHVSYEDQLRDDMTLKEVVEIAEWSHIKAVIQKCGGNISLAADQLGIHRSVLYKKIQKYRKRDINMVS